MAKYTPDITLNEPAPTMSMNPRKFILWLLIVSIIMIFASLTSGYLVRRAEGNWLVFEMPAMLSVSSIIILLSSVSMHFAYLSARRDNVGILRIALLVTLALGFGFVYTQWLSWKELVAIGVFFGGKGSNPAGSFLYVLTGLHVAHLFAGLLYLLIVLAKAYRYKVHSKNMLGIEMCTTLWHFLGGLWIYLYIFLMLNHQ